MIIAPEATHHAPLEMIRFYKEHFHNVHIINCKKCKNSLALELSGPKTNDILGLQLNTLGIVVLPIDNQLMSSRVRLDGMMGYQCICGNDTRASEIEERHSPTGDFHPHEVAAIKSEFQSIGWAPPVKNINGKEHRDTFVAERA